MKLPQILLLSIPLILAVSCQRDDQVETYQAPKDSSAPSEAIVAASEQPPGAESAPIQWNVPTGWKQLPGGDMRYATFQISNINPNVLLTVIPLGPESGQLLPNLNRWEQQLGLPPSSEADAPKHMTEVKLADSTSANLIDLANKQERMLAAIIPHDNRVWFLKLVGPSTIVTPQKENFGSFIKSIHFTGAQAVAQRSLQQAQQLPAGHPALPQSAADLPAGHPTLPALQDGQNPQPHAGNAAASNTITFSSTWQLPHDWTEEPPKPMRTASWLIDSNGQNGEVIVSKLDANHFGTLLANVNRWRGQVGLGPLADESAIRPQVIKLNGREFSMFDFVGPKGADGSAGRRMMVSMIVNGPDVWFFKLQGGDKLVAGQKGAFEKFVSAVQFRTAEK